MRFFSFDPTHFLNTLNLKYEFDMKSHQVKVVTLLIAGFMSNCQSAIEPPNLMELTIHEIHEAYTKGSLNSEKLTSLYIKRMKSLDQSTGLNSIILINPDALKRARKMDQEFEETGKLRPLHGIPVIVKDNYNTAGLQTTGGSISLEGFEPRTN